MGQQQLILLVLATIIVGLAIVVGIRAFNENAIKSNSDALVQDVVRMANDAQAWKQKPAPFGGQQPADCAADPCAEPDFSGLDDLNQLGYFTDTAIYTNLNGTYTIQAAGGAAGVQISGYSARYDNCVRVTVTGITDNDIVSSAIRVNDPTGASQACTAPAAP